MDNDITVGEFDGTGVWYLPTSFGPQKVAYITEQADGPWAVCGSGLDQRSFAVCRDWSLFSDYWLCKQDGVALDRRGDA